MQGPCQPPSVEQREGSCLPSWAQAAPGPAAGILTPAVVSSWEPRQIPAEEDEADCSSFQARSWPVTCLCPILCLDCCPEKSEPGASPPLGRQQGGKVSSQPHACPQWWCDSVHIVPETLCFLTSTTGLGPLTPPNLNSRSPSPTEA